MSAFTSGRAWVDGIGFWAPHLPGWTAARAVLRGDAPAAAVAAARPSPSLLAPTERRRAPDSVLVALDVAMQACESAGREARSLPGVFASMHGDLAITDYTCTTLATAPTELSPTKFHNSVHNAAAGYWSIATGCTAPCTALAADRHSFAAGLLEALVQVASEGAPALFVAYDVEARGPLVLVSPSEGLLGMSLVLSAARTQHSRACLAWGIDGAGDPAPRRRDDIGSASGNAMAPGLPLFEALAAGTDSVVRLSLSRGLALRLRVAP